MTSVRPITLALIGGDGSGKSSVCGMLEKDFELPFRRIYMGPNFESSNYKLPWTKFLVKLQLARLARKNGMRPQQQAVMTTHCVDFRTKKSGSFRTFCRTGHRFSEYVYRLIVAERLKALGNNIIFDRHFHFDAAVASRETNASLEAEIRRWNYWLLSKTLPGPDLFLFLDASPEVMFERKPEVPIEFLRGQRQLWLDLARERHNFVHIDANQPLEKVYAEVTSIIRQYCRDLRTR